MIDLQTLSLDNNNVASFKNSSHMHISLSEFWLMYYKYSFNYFLLQLLLNIKSPFFSEVMKVYCRLK